VRSNSTVSQVNFEADLYPILVFTCLLVLTEIRRMSFTSSVYKNIVRFCLISFFFAFATNWWTTSCAILPPSNSLTHPWPLLALEVYDELDSTTAHHLHSQPTPSFLPQHQNLIPTRHRFPGRPNPLITDSCDVLSTPSTSRDVVIRGFPSMIMRVIR
jgi:hypothetical protein